MKRPLTLLAFTDVQKAKAHLLLAARVATMMGRKMEEADWSEVYCDAKGIPCTGWSNLNIDVSHDGLGVEHKMMCVKSDKSIAEYCGTSLMHPSATRSIRIPNEADPTKAAHDVLGQYAALIAARTAKVKDASKKTPDMRTGWLLWQDKLQEFLYFEEEMLPPEPKDYRAEWKERTTTGRKRSRSLWVYEVETGRKRYSITTEAGAKIQPYFDVPPPTDKSVYIFRVQGEAIESGLVRLWVTETTAHFLEKAVGTLDTQKLSTAIIETAKGVPADTGSAQKRFTTRIKELIILETAYEALKVAFSGVSDEHMMQLFVAHLQSTQEK